MPGKPKGLPKTGGRKKGSQNKVTADVREAFRMLLESKLPSMSKWLERVAVTDPDKALNIMLSLAEYHIPKLSRSEVKADVEVNEVVNLSNLTFEQLLELKKTSGKH